jgi:hypothetical protein
MAEEVDKILRITRDKAELGDVPFVTFTVHRSEMDPTGETTQVAD